MGRLCLDDNRPKRDWTCRIKRIIGYGRYKRNLWHLGFYRNFRLIRLKRIIGYGRQLGFFGLQR